MVLGLGLIMLAGCGGPSTGRDQGLGPAVTVRGQTRPLVAQEKIHGEVEAVVEHQTDEQKMGDSKRQSTSDIIEERVRLKTNGDVYHPDLFDYHVMVGTGLDQQHMDSEDPSRWSTGRLDEYNVGAELLRNKPYSATVNATESQDLISRRFLGPLQADNQGQSATVSLRPVEALEQASNDNPSESASVARRPEDWPMTFQYSNSDTRQNGFDRLTPDFFARDDERFRYSLGHDFSKLSHLHFDFDHLQSNQETVGSRYNTDTDTYTLAHDYAFGSHEQHRLDSLLNYMDESGSFNYRSLREQERLKLQHTPDLLTRYDLQYTDLERDSLTSRQIRGQAGVEHHLFESLVTSLDGFGSYTGLGDQGDIGQYGGIFGLNYHKTNPLGVLLASYTANYTHTDEEGGSSTGVVIGEAHTANGVIPTELDHANVDVTTIRVRTAAGAYFQQGEDYTISQQDGRVFLYTFVVGGLVPPNFTEGEEFYVDYEYFVSPQRKEDTVRQNAMVRQRFTSGLSLYYAYGTQEQSITSTAAQLIPDEYTMHTFGADYTNKGLFLLAEYSLEDSTLIPMTSKKLQGRYRWLLGPATSAGIGLTNQWLDFGAPDDRQVTLFDASTDVFTRLTDDYSLTGSVDYRNEEDSRFGPTRGFQIKSELGYQHRQFSARVGAELDFLERRGDEVNSVFLFLRLVRRF